MLSRPTGLPDRNGEGARMGEAETVPKFMNQHIVPPKVLPQIRMPQRVKAARRSP